MIALGSVYAHACHEHAWLQLAALHLVVGMWTGGTGASQQHVNSQALRSTSPIGCTTFQSFLFSYEYLQKK
jgi:hypothetical protein